MVISRDQINAFFIKLKKEFQRSNKKIKWKMQHYLAACNNIIPTYETKPINHQNNIILIFCEHTASYDITSGVQRCTKSTAINLKELDQQVILVGICKKAGMIRPLTNTECELFTRDTGISRNYFKNYHTNSKEKLYETIQACQQNNRSCWLIIPDITYHTKKQFTPGLQAIRCARELSLKVGAIFYDTIPLMDRECGTQATLLHRNYVTWLSLVDIIWPISLFSATSLSEVYNHYLHLNSTNTLTITPISLGEDINKIDTRSKKRLSITNRNILCIGYICERKNQINLLRAFNNYCQQHPETKWTLTILGQINKSVEKEFKQEHDKNHRIHVDHHASYAKVIRAIQHCDFSVFPSLLEGYGLPIVESLWHYRPVICANFGSMADIAEYGGCITLNTHDVNALTSAISTLIHDKKLYRCKVNEIENRQHKGWKDYANDLINSMNSYEHNRCNGPTYPCNSTVQAFMNSNQALYDLFRPKLTISIINMSEVSDNDLITEQLASIMEQNSDIEYIIGNIRNHTIQNLSEKTDIYERIRIVNNPSKLNKKSFVLEIIAKSSSNNVWITSKPNAITPEKIHSLIKSIDRQNSKHSNWESDESGSDILDAVLSKQVALQKTIEFQAVIKQLERKCLL